MLYSMLIYGDEDLVSDWTVQEESAVMARHWALRERLTAQRKLGPAVRLMRTTTATTLRSTGEEVIIDGPFAETKEQLLGIYVVDCATLDEAIAVARALSFESAVLEIRPVALFELGGALR
ncbi:MAG: YciI family protein [Betaproteobacteria bacterium]